MARIKVISANILSSIKTKRASVLPYTIINGKIFFLLGVDYKTNDITDLGGGVKKNEYSLSAALREFKEETNEIFDSIYYNRNQVSNIIAIQSKNMCCIFVPINSAWFYKTSIEFRKSKKNKEISELIWFSLDEFYKLLLNKNSTMWSKIKNFYRDAFTSELIKMLEMIYI